MLKSTFFGFIAGSLALLTVILGVYLSFTLFSLVFLILGDLSKQATEVPTVLNATSDQIGSLLLDTLNNLYTGLWRDRLGFVVCGLLGIFAAWGHQVGLRIERQHAWLISFSSVAMLISVTAITWLVAERAEIGLWIAEQPESFGWRGQLPNSYLFEIGLGLLFGLCVTYVFWNLWRWWYIRILDWLGLGDMLILEQSVEQASNDAWSLAQMAQSNRLLMLLLFLLILSIALLFPLNQYQAQNRVKVEHGTARLDAISRPQHSFPVQLRPDVRGFTVVRLAGDGTVHLYLSPTANLEDAIIQVKAWSFGRNAPNEYKKLPVDGVASGSYFLHFRQEQGVGYFEYTLSHGGGIQSQLASVAIGFLLAISLILSGMLLLLGIGRLRL